MEKKLVNEAEKLLSEICGKYKHHNRNVMQGVEGERLHALDVLSWVKKLNKKPSLALKLAALFHDIDRIVTPKMGGGFKGKRNSKEYFKHKKNHAKRSANFTAPLFKRFLLNKEIIKKMTFLITHHDDTGEEIEKLKLPDLDCLVAADSFALFTSIAPKLYKVESEKRIKDKIKFMIDKMPEFARIKLWEHQLESKIFNKIKNEIIKEYYIKNNSREKEYKFCPICKTALIRRELDRRNLLSCPKCNFVFWNNPKPVVSVILEKSKKIFLIKRNKTSLKGYWVLPGGYVDYQEKPEEALIRETKEETNLDINITGLVGVYQIDNDPRGINLDIIYYGVIKSGRLILNQESSEFKFFPIDKLPDLIAYKHREAILDWSKNFI